MKTRSHQRQPINRINYRKEPNRNSEMKNCCKDSTADLNWKST